MHKVGIEAKLPRAPFLHRVMGKHLQGVDFAIATVLLLAVVPHLLGSPNNRHTGSGYALLVLTLGAAVPIAIRRRVPIAALGIATASLATATAIGQSFAPIPLIAIPMFQVASTRERRQSIPAVVIVSVAMSIAAIIGSINFPQEGEATFSVVIAIAVWFIGDSVRVRRAYSAGLAEQAAQRSREAVERAQRGVAEERLRIARELHDVVAHSLSVIAVQSGVGRHVIDTQPSEAKKALAAVEITSRSALDELRHMLGMLRRESDNQPNLSPAPGISNLPSLAEQIQATGIGVELHIPDAMANQISPAMQQSIYRIIQEALTNVVKHAGPATARVDLRDDNNAIIIEVIDNGTGSRRVNRIDDHPNGDHHGIVGMRERVALYEGTFFASPLHGGGFRVFARLPLEAHTP